MAATEKSIEKTDRYMTVTVNLADRDFPLSGSELKKALYNLWMLEVMLIEPEKFETYKELKPAECAAMKELFEWSKTKRSK